MRSVDPFLTSCMTGFPHLLHVIGCRRASQIPVKPVKMRIIVERHGLDAAWPMSVVFEYDQARGYSHPLKISEELKTLCIRHAVISLTRDDQARGLEVLDETVWCPLLVQARFPGGFPADRIPETRVLLLLRA